MDGVRVSRSCVIPWREIELSFSRSGGPGGQNVNRRETRVELVFDVTNSKSLGPRQRARVMDRLASKLDSRGRLRIVSSQTRTQAGNREIALERFRELMAEALRPPPPPRRKTAPSKAARERRLASKRRRSSLKRERGWKEED